MILMRYIFRDHLVGHIPATAAEVSPCPQMPTPKLLLQMRKFSHQLVRTLPLQPLDQPTDCHLRRYRHEQMQMVLRHMSLQDRYFVLPADLTDYVSYSRRHFPRQRCPTVFGRPYQMQMYLEYRVCSASILLHPHTLPQCHKNLLKPSPKGEGFNPPRVGQ